LGIGPGGRTTYEIDISKHEYCDPKTAVNWGGYTIYVYPPTLIVCEKLRAICQQHNDYRIIVRKHAAPRARDFFDICGLIDQFPIDLTSKINLEMLCHVFKAKRVPLALLDRIDEVKDLHEQDWPSVRDTVATSYDLREFDWYFTKVTKIAKLLAERLGDM
jgi:hypothetical protein